ncbi:MAG TPA: alkaline phosphatase family protein [Ornithinibacter sp.]|nr:alkaline phosphatase family protein [Ornithinibacter sp.]HQZ10310.1 alkaline phosphatase family protein [Ornithinibacter sp.]
MPSTGDPSAAAPVGSAPSLADVLPSVARSLGVAWGTPRAGGDPAASDGFAFPPTRRAVVVLIDGLGHDLLVRRAGHAPWLRSRLPGTQRVASGFPSTTATSMGTFGTGLAAGAHGLLGYEVLVPGHDRLLNELSWEDGPDPRLWQPHGTVFEAVEREGVEVVRIGPAYFDGSGLTTAALRGGRFVAATSLEARVDAALAAVRAAPRTLVHLYWGELDKVGHVHGCDSWQWGEELEAVDRELARLAARLPADCSLTVTADHGMVDSPHELRLDVAHEPVLAHGVRHVSAEARAPQLYVEPGAADDVRAAWAEHLGDRALVRSREEAVAAGWFGAVLPENLPRIGDVVVAMRGRFAVEDSRRARSELLALLGLHGSLSDDEVSVPVVHVPSAVVA